MDRTFVLPVLSSLSLFATACSTGERSIKGEWIATSFSYDGDVVKLPYTYASTDQGVEYSATSGVGLVVSAGGEAELGTYSSYSNGSDDYTYDYAYSGTWDKQQRIYAFDFPEMELSMDCTLEQGELACAGKFDGEPIDLEFRRKRPGRDGR